MIKVYQIQLTNEEVDIVNTDGEWTPRIKAFFDRSLDSKFKAENFQYYTHVANVAGDNMEDMEKAFELMNLWERPELVDKLGPCSSMSVGDILDVDGKLFRCASFGFTLLENYQRD